MSSRPAVPNRALTLRQYVHHHRRCCRHHQHHHRGKLGGIVPVTIKIMLFEAGHVTLGAVIVSAIVVCVKKAARHMSL